MKAYFLILFISSLFVACTSNKQSASEAVVQGVKAPKQLMIEKLNGINMGESTAIWGAGMKNVYTDTAGKLRQTIKINYLSLDPLKSYPRQIWDWEVPTELIGGKGIRTYVTEWGSMLIAKTGSFHAGLFLADVNSKTVKKIFSTSDPGYYPLDKLNLPPDSKDDPYTRRSAALSYKVGNHKFIALVYRRSSSMTESKPSTTFRIERFWYKDGNFVRVRPFDFENTKMADKSYDVYSSFLDACSTQARNSSGECAPRLYMTCYDCVRANIQGVDLTADSNPPTLYSASSSSVTPVEVVATNSSFNSTSHPITNDLLGTINNNVYSMGGDPDEGYIYRSNVNSGGSDSHVAYDRLNGLVYRADRSSKLMPDGTIGATATSVISVFKKECFFSNDVNCGPLVVGSAANSKIFRDTGNEMIGPSSDLGDGCIATLALDNGASLSREKTAPYSGVYKTCIRDKDDLSKGISMMKIAEFEGRLYMYNDFTGATLYDRPVEIEYNFADEGFKTISTATFSWEPRTGFSGSKILDLDIQYRCYNKGGPVPTGYSTWPITQIGSGFTSTKIPLCAGNIVQIKINKAGPKFTRFRSLKVTGYE